MTDPPYSLGYDFENDKLSYAEQGAFMAKYLLRMYRVLKDGGTACICMSQEMSHFLYFVGLGSGFVWQNEIVWHRDGGQMPKKKFGICHEIVMIFTKGENHKTFNLDDVRVMSKYAETDKRLNKAGKNPGDVWYVPALFGRKQERIKDDLTGKAIHPTQKPEGLFIPMVKAYSNPGDIILDCFCGTGTVLKVAKDFGRNFIGIDISKKYCNIARKRIGS